MANHTESPKPGLATSIISNKCPHCREGNLFVDPNPYHLKSTMTMPEHCPECGQRYDLQTGFYFGTGFVSYGLTVAVSFATFVLWWFFIGMGIKDNRVWYWLASNAGLLILLQPIIQRLARSIWIALFVKYDPNWKNNGAIA